MYFRLTSETGKRERWTVKISGAKLSECCTERMGYHRERVAFWEKALATAEQSLRSDGIQLKHFEVTGGRRTEAQLDPSLAKRVAECEQRLKSNRDAVNRFAAYRALLAAGGPNAEYELNADDVLYFNLEGADIGGDGDAGEPGQESGLQSQLGRMNSDNLR
jgi:hypothetical protein